MRKLLIYLLTVVMLTGCAHAQEATYVRAARGNIRTNPLFVTERDDADIADLLCSHLFDRTASGAVATDESEAAEHGVADVTIEKQSDGSVNYNITLREGLYFSDGEEIDADDVIFAMYVLLDPTYDGGLALSDVSISGLDDYRGTMLPLYELLLSAGRDNENFALWAQETQTSFWEAVDEAGTQLARDVTDYQVSNFLTEDTATLIGSSVEAIQKDSRLQLHFAMEMDGFGSAWTEDATATDFWQAMVNGYDGDPVVAANAEGLGTGLLERMGDAIDSYSRGVSVSDGAASVGGIERTGRYSLTVHAEKYSAGDPETLNIPVVPLHVFGDAGAYDYENGNFGFSKGNLSAVRAARATVSCGKYTVAADEAGACVLEANPSAQDAPDLPRLIVVKVDEDSLMDGLTDASIDCARVSWSEDNAELPAEAGTVLSATPVVSKTYAVIGISAGRVKIGEAGSDGSKALRKALLGLFEAQRASAVQSVYGAWATAIADPVWPGSPLYANRSCEDVTADEALENAIALLQTAGYVWDGEKFTAAPEGGSMTFTISFAEGAEDSVGYIMAERVRAQLEQIGITLTIRLIDPLIWQGNIENGMEQIWIAERSGEYAPDLSALYHSADPAEMNVFGLSDEKADACLAELETATDTAERREICTRLMDIVRDWGVSAGVYCLNDMLITRG